MHESNIFIDGYIISMFYRDTQLRLLPCDCTAGERMSVRPSVKRVHCDKTKEICAHILYHIKDRSS